MIGTDISHYQITAKLGQGGMGEVYRATDTKLDRDVAIKVLPESFARDKERLARFDREAKSLAALNHPNIAGIFGIEEEGDLHALIMELVEGEDLSQRIKRGPMPVEEALDVCKQIAEALETAHGKGIIHRDLKPGNVKLTEDGRVKVLDFGLAKATTHEVSNASTTDSVSPTITADYTMPGTLLGTAAYMSPEQARGKEVDKRSDIWSFGCVLFECLTGKRMFKGEDTTQTLAKILEGEPDWSALPQDTPPTIHLLLRKCLAKDRKRRLPDIAAARIDLEEAIADPSSSFIRLSNESRTETSKRTGVPLAMVIGVVVVALVIGWFLKPTTPAPESSAQNENTPERLPIRAEIVAPGEFDYTIRGQETAFVLSPDGKYLIYNLDDSGRGLRRREINGWEDINLTGTGSPNYGNGEGQLFISWDGKQLGYREENSLVKIPISGGQPQTLIESDWISGGIRGVTWGPEGQVVFGVIKHGLQIATPKQRTPSTLTELNGDREHVFPQFLPPHGSNVLFLAVKHGVLESDAVAKIVNTTTGAVIELDRISECNYVRYIQSGHLVWAKGENLWAIRFNPETLETAGTEKEVLNGVATSGGWRSQFDTSDNGTLVYMPPVEQTRTLVWINSSGQFERFTEYSGDWFGFSISGDEKRVAIDSGKDIHILEVSDASNHRLWPMTQTESRESLPIWSPDGENVFFFSLRPDGNGIWKQRADPAGAEPELVMDIGDNFGANPASVDEKFLYAAVQDAQNNWDIWRLEFATGVTSKVFTKTYSEGWPMVSPDRKWLAYFSTRFGRTVQSVWVTPLPLSSDQSPTLVSMGKAGVPRWGPNSSNIYFQSGDEIWETPLIDGQTPSPRKYVTISSDVVHQHWTTTISPKSGNVLALVDIENVDGPRPENKPDHLKVVFNWFTELNRLVPPVEE